MGERVKNTVEIPIWMVGLLVTVMMAIFSWGLATASNSSAVNRQVEVNTEVLKELKQTDKDLGINKADKDIVETIMTQLNRIERKLDSHMAK